MRLKETSSPPKSKQPQQQQETCDATHPIQQSSPPQPTPGSPQTRYSQVRKRRAAISSGTKATQIRHILWQEDESLCSTELEQSRLTAGNKHKGGEVGGVSGKVRREGQREGQMEAAGILTFLEGGRKVEKRKGGVTVQIQNHLIGT